MLLEHNLPVSSLHSTSYCLCRTVIFAERVVACSFAHREVHSSGRLDWVNITTFEGEPSGAPPAHCTNLTVLPKGICQSCWLDRGRYAADRRSKASPAKPEGRTVGLYELHLYLRSVLCDKCQ